MGYRMHKPGDTVLRAHQEEAVEAIVRGLEVPASGVPEGGLRATVVAACGTGKTVMAAAAALRVARGGRILILLPTLDLLAQTIGAWRAAGHHGPAVAVCSLSDDPQLSTFGVRSTTSPPQLALWHGRGPVTVYGTYASLPVVAEAHQGVYGQKLDPFDLVVVDEAHRTSGAVGKAWADVHRQDVIPALRRLYLTATPRVWADRPPQTPAQQRITEAARRIEQGEERAKAAAEGRAYTPPGPVRDRLTKELACSMDDPAVFGPVVYELPLSDAIARGLLARYQVVVAELTDPVVTPDRLYGAGRSDEELRGQRLAAVQTALLETMAEHALRTTITFHHRTIEAEAFATGLPRVAARLHAVDPDRHPAPERVWTGWLSGQHDGAHRAAVIDAFGRRRGGRAVLANCRVLGEGVDIRAVDSVALIDPKGSAVDIVQAVGRALRQTPGEGKLATLVVPVFLGPDEQPEEILTSNSYGPLIRVLAGLRAHDERAVEMLAVPQEAQRNVVTPSRSIGELPPDGEGEGGAEPRLLLRFAAPRDPALIAKWITYQVLDTEHTAWRRGLDAAMRYREREEHLDVPYEHLEGQYPLGRWLSDQRRNYRAGAMHETRVSELEGLGVVWDVTDAGFEANLAAARAFHAVHGTLAAPRHAVALDRAVGQWLTNVRRAGGLGKDAARAERRAHALAAIDPDWNPGALGWTVDWQRHHAYLTQALAAGARIEEVVPGVTWHTEDIGRWLATQRRDYRRLNDEQRARLRALGVSPAPPPASVRTDGAGGGAGTSVEAETGPGAAAFRRGLAALTQYLAREGTMVIPRAHIEHLPGPDGSVAHRTGVWLANQRQRRHTLTPSRLAALADLGITWAQ
ncbi:Helicase associated domain protein [Streptomyces sp. NPDC097619]|uniref:DEAD/DEAH box helicase n=1 Tax=Streptomyces sp. NPDC097619 TaxID=3157228 RepID=UPI003321B559